MDDDLKALYQTAILDHSRQPRNRGKPEGCTHRARGYNPLCGDQITVYMEVDGDRIAAAGFEGKGCALCLASASMMTEAIASANKATLVNLLDDLKLICTQEQAETVNAPEEIAPLLPLSGVRAYPVRVKCVTLPWQTALAAIAGEGEATTE